MKHWDGRDRPQAIELRPPRRDRVRLAEMPDAPVRTPRRPPQIESMIGLVLALGLFAGLLWALFPDGPVSSKILN